MYVSIFKKIGEPPYENENVVVENMYISTGTEKDAMTNKPTGRITRAGTLVLKEGETWLPLIDCKYMITVADDESGFFLENVWFCNIDGMPTLMFIDKM